MDDCVIRVTGLKKSFPKGKEVLCVLKGIEYGDPAGRGDRLPWK